MIMNPESFYKNKKVLVVGAGGMIGSCLVKALSILGCDLRLVYHNAPNNPTKGAIISVADITKPEVWDELASNDVIFHLAAHESGNFEPEEDLKTNALSVLYLLESCRRKEVFPKIVFASSSNLVGAPDKMPVDETFKDNPLTIFAIHKLTAEEYLKLYFHDFGIPSIALRLANVYGPSMEMSLSLHSTLNKMVNNAVAGKPLKLFANKDKIRDFLYIDDAARAFLAAGSLPNEKSGVYIAGSEEGKSFKTIVELVAELVSKTSGRRPEIIIDRETPIKAVEMRNFVADSSKFKKASGWKPQTMLRSGLQKTINYFLKINN